MSSSARKHKIGHVQTAFGMSCLFTYVYVLIHIGINSCQNITLQCEALSLSDFPFSMVVGPLKIGLASGLLFFSFGAFLIHAVDDLSVSTPIVFFKAFLIFTVGQVAVQIAGHAEIVFNSIPVSPSVEGPSNWLKITLYAVGNLALCAALLTLAMLEFYFSAAYAALRQRAHRMTAIRLAVLAFFSFCLVVLKTVIVASQMAATADYTVAKLNTTAATFAFEFVICAVTVFQIFAIESRQRNSIVKDTRA